MIWAPFTYAADVAASNIVEHPEVVANRLIRYAEVVGRHKVMAGTD